MKSNVKTVNEYLDSLPEDRKKAISIVRKEIKKNLPKGMEEKMNWGMISYQVPLKTYPNTYNGQPLMYAALAAQKNYMVVYLMNIYASSELRKKFETDYKATGKRFDVGGSCVRFRKLDDLPVELIGKMIASMSLEQYLEYCEKAFLKRKTKKKKVA